MRRFLLWISLCLINCLFAYGQEEAGEVLLFPYDVTYVRYQSYISFKAHDISGLCLLKQDEQQVTGCLMNEFGIKAFDLVYSKKSKKLKLLHVLPFLNKWYIKKVLRADWKYLLEAKQSTEGTGGKRVLERDDQGTIQLKNLRFQITYRLVPMDEQKE